jgi:hypothetical protein
MATISVELGSDNNNNNNNNGGGGGGGSNKNHAKWETWMGSVSMWVLSLTSHPLVRNDQVSAGIGTGTGTGNRALRLPVISAAQHPNTLLFL